jgi:hypothetical protein
VAWNNRDLDVVLHPEEGRLVKGCAKAGIRERYEGTRLQGF